MKGQFLFLGTGGSVGIPIIGCDCDVCLSSNPYNKRLRPSGLISIGQKKILIDVGPDFRQQALRCGISNIDALLLTHIHSDHIAGIDDLRIFYFRNKKEIDCYLSEDTFEDLKIRYHYIFRPVDSLPTISAQLGLHLLKEEIGSFTCQNYKISYMSYSQGGIKVTGFRIGNLAYVSDIKEYPDTIFKALEGVDILILSALKKDRSPVHFNIDEAIEFSNLIKPKKTYLTHLSHELDHDQTNQELPKDIRLAYDGLEVEFKYEDR